MRSRWNSSDSRNFASTAGWARAWPICAVAEANWPASICATTLATTPVPAPVSPKHPVAGSSNASATAPMRALRTNRSMAAIGAIANTIV